MEQCLFSQWQQHYKVLLMVCYLEHFENQLYVSIQCMLFIFFLFLQKINLQHAPHIME